MALEFLGDALGAIISGGATGLLGSVATGLVELKKAKLNTDLQRDTMKHDESMLQLQTEADKVKYDAQINGAKVESDAKIQIADVEAFKTAQQMDKATYSENQSGVMKYIMGSIDWVRGMIRPVLTIWFTYLAWRIYVDVSDKIKDVPVTDIQQLLSLHQQITMMLLYLTTSAVLFWFGSRWKVQPVIDFRSRK